MAKLTNAIIAEQDGLEDTVARRPIIKPVPNSIIWGTEGNDSLVGTTVSDTLHGLGGQDTLIGNNGADTLYGDEGNDLIYGGVVDQNAVDGNDLIYGGNGNDTIYGGNGNDVIYGENGSDTVYGGAGDDYISVDNDASPGNDPGFNYVDGGDGNDYIYAAAGGNELHGGNGNDAIALDNGGPGANLIYGEGGTDNILVQGVQISVFGGDGNDTIQSLSFQPLGGSHVGNLLDGGNGDDQITVRNIHDVVDTVVGGAGNDLILGGNSTHSLIINGGIGNDTMTGGSANDTMTGGAGNDIFRFTGSFGDDRITDFNVSEDRIDVTALNVRFEDLDFTQYAVRDPSGVMVGWVEVTLPNGSTIALQGLNMSDMTPDIFLGLAASSVTGTPTNKDDVLVGSSGNDTIIGLGGHDVLTGGAGDDVFRFWSNFGADRITDFQIGHDRIDLSHFGGLSFADLNIAQNRDGAYITIIGNSNGSADALFLTSIRADLLTPDSFIF